MDDFWNSEYGREIDAHIWISKYEREMDAHDHRAEMKCALQTQIMEAIECRIVEEREAAFRAGLEAVARHHDAEAARYRGCRTVNPAADLLMREHEDDACFIRSGFFIPPEYAAPNPCLPTESALRDKP